MLSKLNTVFNRAVYVTMLFAAVLTTTSVRSQINDTEGIWKGTISCGVLQVSSTRSNKAFISPIEINSSLGSLIGKRENKEVSESFSGSIDQSGHVKLEGIGSLKDDATRVWKYKLNGLQTGSTMQLDGLMESEDRKVRLRNCQLELSNSEIERKRLSDSSKQDKVKAAADKLAIDQASDKKAILEKAALDRASAEKVATEASANKGEAMKAKNEAKKAPYPCLNNICIGQSFYDLPLDIWEKKLVLQTIRSNPVYLAARGKQYFDAVEKQPLIDQPFLLSVVIEKFDGTLIRHLLAKQASRPNGYCATGIVFTGEFKDAAGRIVEVKVTGGMPPGKVAGFYVSEIKKVFGRDLDMKKFESEIRKTWPDALVKEFHEEIAMNSPVVIDTIFGHLILQLPLTERKDWRKASQESLACAPDRQKEELKYKIN